MEESRNEPLDLKQLEAQAQEILAKDTSTVPEFWAKKYQNEAKRNWDIFYKRNETNFFKDRHWTEREFTELAEIGDKKFVLFEVGCGVGNFFFPVLNVHPNIFVYACDFSPRAIDFVKKNPKYDQHIHAFVCDVTKEEEIQKEVPESSVDLATLVFVLSAIPPENMSTVLQSIFRTLKPGGLLCFRDYGKYDLAQLRFKPGHKLRDNFYVRQDGTMAYYFDLEFLSKLATVAGFVIVENEYVFSKLVNKKNRVQRR